MASAPSAALHGISGAGALRTALSGLKASGAVAFIRVSWETAKQHVLAYTGSADGLETWVDIDLGRNSWRASRMYAAIAEAADRSRAYACSGLSGG
ncbi:MAG: hypothetical protein HY518_01855 [Candidatus Aenigmarchaeota archaeon]|nr:hypothetical protein [Candidatus Aenigmarchaeota archaeon]